MDKKIKVTALLMGLLFILFSLNLMMMEINTSKEIKSVVKKASENGGSVADKEVFLQKFKSICIDYIKNSNWCNTVKVEFKNGGVSNGETLYVLGDHNSINRFKFDDKIIRKNYTPTINHELTHAYIIFNVKNKRNYELLTIDAQNHFKDYNNNKFSKSNAMEVETECVMAKKFNYGDDYIKHSFYLSLSSTIISNGVEKGCGVAEKLLKKYSY